VSVPSKSIASASAAAGASTAGSNASSARRSDGRHRRECSLEPTLTIVHDGEILGERRGAPYTRRPLPGGARKT
jgi:hypothetical protein